MSIAKVNHPVWKAIDAQSLAVDGAGDNASSEWWDTNGWTDKVISAECTKAAGSGAIDININMLVSPKGYYELNNETTVDTEDYESIAIVDALAVGTLTRYDSSDVDDLQRPIRSMKLYVENDNSADACTVNIWVEGWS